jgi:hypothetical protein
MNSTNEQNIAKNFANMLNHHGYAFQYSSIRIADKLFAERNSKWIFQASEFPVELSNRSKGTRIDFILKSRDCPLYLLFECKRAVRDKPNEEFELRLLMPKAKRSLNDEFRARNMRLINQNLYISTNFANTFSLCSSWKI